MRLIANKRFAYPFNAAAMEIGDEFEVPIRIAKIFIATGAATPAPLPEDKKRGRYKRRDMRPVDDAAMTAGDK